MMQAGIPIAFAVFLVCLLQSVYKKAQARHNFNRETIDNNTSEFRAALQDLRVMFEDFESKITRAQMNSTIKVLTHIGAEEKTQLYEKLKIMIDKYDKCNYVLAVGKNEIPFPYTEVIIDGFMVLLILIAVVWVIGEIAPAQRFKDIKKNNKRQEEALYKSSDATWTDAVIAEAQCHDASMENIMFTLKILFFIFIVMFLIFYATKVLASTSEYEFGIYNSMYFEESICLE
jgi:Na+-transporting methylmalonyl-CoA/oxaloacetate decarboxylase gamma subunit